MNKARVIAKRLRRKCGVIGVLDVEALANMLGLNVMSWPLTNIFEVIAANDALVADRLDGSWRRWSIAHAIGHHHFHEGSDLWLRSMTTLSIKYEREAEEFAYHLL